ncbi:MAG TPA: RNA polymerase sigma-70 factor [Chryseolinea sp.]|nr:RNA polymerase sigma-70 factor [Chryseolinea sp.]
MIDPRENKLLSLLKKDDQSAIKIIFEKYHTSLCILAFRLTRNRDLSKDIVQDVFTKFWNNRNTIEITSSLSAYLKRSVINAALNELEKDRRHSKIELENLPHPLMSASDADHSFAELSSHLERAINTLPPRTRAIFLLVRREEMSYKEVSESMSISLKAVEKEMMKALKLLRGMMKNFLPVMLILPIV